MSSPESREPLAQVWGAGQSVPVLGGGHRRYVNLDNAASTPPLADVQRFVDDFLLWYGSVHRGAGFKSQLASQALEAARETVLRFVGADPGTHTAVFGKNTTEAINRLARIFPFGPDDVVLLTGMEHHSNDLPWRAVARVDYAAVTDSGELDLDDLATRLRRHGGRVRLVAVTGASNVTGVINPVHEIARLAHEQGALILVDAAQLAPHRAIRMAQPDPAASLDFLVFSGHKMYAPYGAGALVAPLRFLDQAEPDHRGGGAVAVISLEEVHFAGAPDRVEPGSPNTTGITAMARAMQVLTRIGMDRLAEHESRLTAYALTQLQAIPGVRVFGPADPSRAAARVGVIPFEVQGVPHGLVAAILAEEGAIGVRNGCFCAHPYVIRLLGVDRSRYARFRDRVLAGDRSDVPGLVRISFGLHNTADDIDALVAMLRRIARGEHADGYRLDPASGDYHNVYFQPEYRRYLPFGA